VWFGKIPKSSIQEESSAQNLRETGLRRIECFKQPSKGKRGKNMTATNGNKNMGAGLAVGIGVGTALGVALGNVAIGLAMGVAIGLALGSSGVFSGKPLNPK
jgi:hypothetical protein